MGQQSITLGWTSPHDQFARVCGISRRLKFLLRSLTPLTDRMKTPLWFRRNSWSVSSAFMINTLNFYKPRKKTHQLMTKWSLTSPAGVLHPQGAKGVDDVSSL